MKFPIKDFFSKCEQIRRKLRICSHLLKKSLMENFIFCAVIDHGVKETYAIMSTEVTYETDHISLLCDSTISSAPNFCFFMYFIVI